MTPIKIGITGGIGSGKSVVSQLLQIFDIPVYDCDAEAKRLNVTDPIIRQQLIALIGPEVYSNNSHSKIEEVPFKAREDIIINKSVLANYLFASADHVKQVNSIIHPRVKEDFKLWVQQHSICKFVAMESAILFEAGFQDVVDEVLMIDAPVDVRIIRAMQRDQASQEAIEKRIRQQMDDEEKKSRSHYVVSNDGKTPLIPQVLDFIDMLCEKYCVSSHR